MSAIAADRPLDIAVIGAGIAGLGAAWLLSRRHRVTLYEKNDYLGGHSNTVVVDHGGRRIAVDTGFIVYNEVNYPNLTRLFRLLEVPTRPSVMSFSVSLDEGRLEYSGGELSGLFAQRRNLLRFGHWRMLGCALRFFHRAPRLLDEPGDGPTLGEFLARGRYSRAFIEDHLLPMGAAIWSVPPATMTQFPAKSFVQFFHNHGLLRLTGRPGWRTVSGGAREYVARLVEDMRGAARLAAPVAAVRRVGSRVVVATRDGASQDYDQAVIGAHADEALAMLAEPTPAERRLLGAFRYQRNRAVLHRDESLMPRRRRAWASWNYLASGADARQRDTAVTYWMNRLQGIDPAHPLFVTLNARREPDPGLVFARFDYDHPVYDAAAMAAQRALPSIQGTRGLWFCGSYCGYGFHEDGLVAGLEVAEALGVERPWAAELAGAPARADARRRFPIARPAPAAGAD